MAKLSKSLLKEIVKECLVELLAEGLSGGNSSNLSESFDRVSSERKPSFKSNSIKKQNIERMLPKENSVQNKNFESKTKEVIQNATKDPIMAALLEDTARTTLQEQNSADQPNRFSAKGHDHASRIVENSDPADLFGEASNNWSHLAFFDEEK